MGVHSCVVVVISVVFIATGAKNRKNGHLGNLCDT